MARSNIPAVPAAFFGMVLGLAGLGGAWRAAHAAWALPALVGEAIMAVAALVWLIVLIGYGLKWIVAREAALAELAHPVQCCFVGLAGVSTMLIAGGAAPYAHRLALALYGLGLSFTIGFAVWRTGGLWLGGRDPGHSTPILYLPSVAGSFVAAIVGSGLGLGDGGSFFFGMGLFGWLAIESVLLHRMLTSPPMPGALRPTLGVQLAPPVVGAVALMAAVPQAPLWVVHAMIGYGLFQALILLRLLPWVLEEPFSAGYWAFTFGATALATAPIRLVVRGDDGVVIWLAPLLFGFANLVVLIVAAGTVWRLAQGRLLPRPAAPPAA